MIGLPRWPAKTLKQRNPGGSRWPFMSFDQVTPWAESQSGTVPQEDHQQGVQQDQHGCVSHPQLLRHELGQCRRLRLATVRLRDARDRAGLLVSAQGGVGGYGKVRAVARHPAGNRRGGLSGRDRRRHEAEPLVGHRERSNRQTARHDEEGRNVGKHVDTQVHAPTRGPLPQRVQ